MNRTMGLYAGLGLLGLSAMLAVACGDSKEGSLLENGAGANGTGANNGKGGSAGSLMLGDGGDDQGLGVGGDGAGGDDSCAPVRLVADPPLVNVLLVVDKSGSMSDEPAGFDSDKWTALRSALEATFQETEAKISFGLDLYPYSGTSGQALDNSCQMPSGDEVVVDVQAGTDATPLILAALDDNPPDGGTPTAAALARAWAYYTTGAGKDLKGERYVLLATDGGPNCNEDLTCTATNCTVNIDGLCPPNTNCCAANVDPDGPSKCLDEAASVAAVAKLAEDGIKTFVVGIPGTEDYADTLDLLAAESGVENPDAPPAYFAVNASGGTEGLASVLTSITTTLITTCRLQLEDVPTEAKQVYVFIEDEQIERDSADGWEYDTSTSPPTIQLNGATCEKVETEGIAALDIRYYCPGTEPK